ncbi:GAF domain-containing protein [Sphingomonas sp. HF-S3]|uniref:GAF domain-containing protein n=1 Tax=Sphingomonas rustica TaxID=3103142 RepID=A0ABV0B9G6_9SPHN
MTKDILTTADAARLLGVSIRTAQLLIEGGSVPSWKTPGGHRRVYHADIDALIEGRGAEARRLSADLVIVAPAERLERYRRLFAELEECRVQFFDALHPALFTIATLRPHGVIVDVTGGDPHWAEFLRRLEDNPSLGHSRLYAVGMAEPLTGAGATRIVAVDAPEALPAAVRRSLIPESTPSPAAGESPFPVAINEAQRLVALERTGLLDTVPEEAFDRVTWLAAQTLNAPIALITLLTPTRQWFKSRIGLALAETPRSWAFCNHTILQKRVFMVEDLAGDMRFADNPAVAGQPGFRFYAGAPILDGDGFPVGSLCVIDYQARTMSARDEQLLASLAALASAEVRLRRSERELRAASRKP